MTKQEKSVATLGSKTDPAQLEAAVDAWIELEGSGPVSKSEIGRRLGLERAPEWLDSPLFLKKLDVARFTKEVQRLRSTKELIGLLDKVLDASLIEGYKRLTLNPSEIPPSVLFGETLLKLVRLRHELAGSLGSRGTQNIWINIQQEINNVQDPTLRQKLASRFRHEIDTAIKILEDKSEQTGDVVDVAPIQLSPEPTSSSPPALPAGQGTSDSTSLWNDPALD